MIPKLYFAEALVVLLVNLFARRVVTIQTSVLLLQFMDDMGRRCTTNGESRALTINTVSHRLEDGLHL